MYTTCALPNFDLSETDIITDATAEESFNSVRKPKEVVVASKKPIKNNRIRIKTLLKRFGQIRGKKIMKLPRTGKTVVLGHKYGYSLRHGHPRSNLSSRQVLRTPGCGPHDIYVNYIYEYDIHNHVFNSSFRDLKSTVVQNLQSEIALSTSEELLKRNLISYVTDKVHLIKIMDVSQQYNNRATLRFYVSINVSKNLIPVIRRILETVFTKLKNERFATPCKKVDWEKMVLIPITKR